MQCGQKSLPHILLLIGVACFLWTCRALIFEVFLRGLVWRQRKFAFKVGSLCNEGVVWQTIVFGVSCIVVIARVLLLVGWHESCTWFLFLPLIYMSERVYTSPWAGWFWDPISLRYLFVFVGWSRMKLVNVVQVEGVVVSLHEVRRNRKGTTLVNNELELLAKFNF